jgi:hypothetical protein
MLRGAAINGYGQAAKVGRSDSEFAYMGRQRAVGEPTAIERMCQLRNGLTSINDHQRQKQRVAPGKDATRLHEKWFDALRAEW